MNLLVIFTTLLSGANDGAGRAARGEADGFRIVGYLPFYRAADYDLSHAAPLTDLILFAGKPLANGELDWSEAKRQFSMPEVRQWKARRKSRLWLCVGGWNRSEHFAQTVASDVNRRRFVESAVRICREEGFDGLDLDWEHPENERQRRGYGLLLQDLKAAFARHDLKLSVTIAGWQRIPRTGVEAVDWIQLMSYDHRGRHSTFDDAKADLQKLTDQGIPRSKITLGVPFYGRSLQRSDHALTYRELLSRFRPAPDVDEVDEFYFNGPRTIERKTRLAIESGLAGVMAWELGQDATGEQSLLRAIVRAIDDVDD